MATQIDLKLRKVELYHFGAHRAQVKSSLSINGVFFSAVSSIAEMLDYEAHINHADTEVTFSAR